MSWSHRIVMIGGHPAGVLMDDRFRGSLPVLELPILSRFRVHCLRDAGPGFWHTDETARLEAIEKELLRLCGRFGDGWAVYVLRIDTRGMREYLFYSGGSAALDRVLSHLQAAHADYRVEFEETGDAEWRHYRAFLPDPEPVS